MNIFKKPTKNFIHVTVIETNEGHAKFRFEGFDGIKGQLPPRVVFIVDKHIYRRDDYDFDATAKEMLEQLIFFYELYEDSMQLEKAEKLNKYLSKVNYEQVLLEQIYKIDLKRYEISVLENEINHLELDLTEITQPEE